jgi:dienelactone hydrolase
MVRKLVLGLAALALVLWVSWRWLGGAAGVVAAALPDFPDLPEPVASLAATSAGEIYFASSTPYDLDVILRDMSHAIPTTGVGTLSLPAGASPENPVPAMVLLHGSGGIRPGRERAYAELLNEAGYAAFVVDYYVPRGIRPDHDYMLKVLSVTEFDAISDAYAALALLATHPAIDGSRIGLAGFSYGGMATRFAMDERIRQALAPQLPGFAAFVDVYGPCFQVLGTKQTNGAPLLTLRGSEDASNDLEACARRENELRELGVAVESHVYEGAGHAWESDLPRRMIDEAPYVSGCEVVYDEDGRSSIDGQGIVQVPVETPRAERVAVRMASGGPMRDCVKSGYVIGSDRETQRKANTALLAFLATALGASAP